MNKTSIEWTDYTWNPVTGCTKVSQGCKFCYAETLMKRFGKTWGQEKFTNVTLHPDRLYEPGKMRNKLKGKKVFVCDMSDLFHEDVPFEFIYRVFSRMGNCPDTIFQVLTKRISRAVEFYKWFDDVIMKLGYAAELISPEFPIPNIWIGTSCEDQDTANERIPLLLQIPASVHFISCEPLIGAIDLAGWIGERYPGENEIYVIDWVIVGGESSRNARPMHPEWVRSLRDQCIETDTPFFFKQWGEWLPLEFDAQPPYRRFSNTDEIIDGHGIDVVNPEDPLGKPGKYAECTFMDAMDAIVFCEEEHATHCDFLRRGKKKWNPTIDGVLYHEFPTKL
jgi:protein gp37